MTKSGGVIDTAKAATGTTPGVPAPDLILMPEAARRLGMHRDTLYKLARTGQFPPAVRIGSKWLVSVPRLERFLHGEQTEAH